MPASRAAEIASGPTVFAAATIRTASGSRPEPSQARATPSRTAATFWAIRLAGTDPLTPRNVTEGHSPTQEEHLSPGGPAAGKGEGAGPGTEAGEGRLCFPYRSRPTLSGRSVRVSSAGSPGSPGPCPPAR